MSELKEHIEETKSSLLDLQVLLQRAKSLRCPDCSRPDVGAHQLLETEASRGGTSAPTKICLSLLEVTDQPECLEFVALPVTHDQALDSCTGTLKFNGYVIAFLRTAGSRDGFNQGLAELEKHEFSDKLGRHFRGKTYRFGPSGVAGKEEGRR